MKEKITKNSPPYPKGYEPDYIFPLKYCSYRYILGKRGKDPLVAICMNPSAANMESSDRTVNRIISISKKLGKDGWIIFNVYPERATDAKKMDAFSQDLLNENIKAIKNCLIENNINEVWAAWGNDKNIKHLIKGKHQVKAMLLSIGVKVYYFGTLTKMGNPRHPLQRQEKFDSSKKEYLDLCL